MEGPKHIVERSNVRTS